MKMKYFTHMTGLSRTKLFWFYEGLCPHNDSAYQETELSWFMCVTVPRSGSIQCLSSHTSPLCLAKSHFLFHAHGAPANFYSSW